MMTIDKIDFSKFKPYDGKQTKSFEQFCYEIAKNQFSHLGKFTPIDGSGGDGGIEFYLELANGELWGWQCKFFSGSGRLQESNRKQQIQKSLKTACEIHQNLKKWFLCLKTDLTGASKATKDKVSSGEIGWFDSTLKSKIPPDMNVELVLWGASELTSYLVNPNNSGIRSFFFGDLGVNQEWFKRRFEDNFEKVRNKYDHDLHCIDEFNKSIIECALLDESYNLRLENLKIKLGGISKNFFDSLSRFSKAEHVEAKGQDAFDNYILTYNQVYKLMEIAIQKVDLLIEYFDENVENEINVFNIEDIVNKYNKLTESNYDCFDEESYLYREGKNVYYISQEFQEIYERFFRNYFHSSQKALHFLGDAANGKTHLSCDIAYSKISNNKPAIFITGDKFSNSSSITDVFLKNLDVPSNYNFEQLLEELDTYASVIKSKIPIIIDALNETTYNGLFSSIWQDNLASFQKKITKTQNLILVTTCRISYKERIWDTDTTTKFNFIYGFGDNETLETAVKKYFHKYNLKTDLTFVDIKKFKDPILLKIFCEMKKSKENKEIEVNLEEESTFDIFNQYILKTNTSLTAKHSFLRQNEPFISRSLSTFTKYLWDNNVREIPIEKFYALMDGNQPYNEAYSKADVLIHEGLLLSRYIRRENEYVSFTYDVMAGFFIATNLIKKHNPKYFFSFNFATRIMDYKSQHPLYDDIMTALCILLLEQNYKVHQIILNKQNAHYNIRKINIQKIVSVINFNSKIMKKYIHYIFALSIDSLFRIKVQYIDDTDINILKNLFYNSADNAKIFIKCSLPILENTLHPLNINFLSDLLKNLPVNMRDIIWSEVIRKENKAIGLIEFLKKFEQNLSRVEKASIIAIKKLHLISKFIMWLLTSSDRELRDLATRSLYYYGRKFPKEYCNLVYFSLDIDDPYIWERTLASLYGITMAEHNALFNKEFRDNILPSIARTLYDLIFKKNAPASTTHILARDYAKKTIEIALLHHNNILNMEEVQRVKPPYCDGGIREWGEFENTRGYEEPIHMDFSNYTIGRLVKDGHSYSNPPEKQKVRRQIYWRIFDLGWNKRLFNEIDTDIYRFSDRNRPRIERYGKKYSWVAYYEVAGFRDDMQLLENEWNEFRIIKSDIDPSFPVNLERKRTISKDLIGNRNIPLGDWYQGDSAVNIDEYLILKNSNSEWVCLDGHVSQEDKEYNRRIFLFIRAFIVRNQDYEEVLDHLNSVNINRREFPEKNENNDAFSGEIYTFNDATHSNYSELEFVLESKTIKVKKGEEGYLPDITFKNSKDEFLEQVFSEEKEITQNTIKKYKVLLPVMKWSWSSENNSINDAESRVLIAKEIAESLELKDQAQTLELYTIKGEKATQYMTYHKNYNDNEELIYLRKDLLDKYLETNNFKLIYVLWGERVPVFDDIVQRGFYKEYGSGDIKQFKSIIKY